MVGSGACSNELHVLRQGTSFPARVFVRSTTCSNGYVCHDNVQRHYTARCAALNLRPSNRFDSHSLIKQLGPIVSETLVRTGKTTRPSNCQHDTTNIQVSSYTWHHRANSGTAEKIFALKRRLRHDCGLSAPATAHRDSGCDHVKDSAEQIVE